jgi:ELWxxDGT repeat protein
MSKHTKRARQPHLTLGARLLVGLVLAGAATAADLVRDINTVPALPIGETVALSRFVNVGTWTAFVLDDGIHGAELWRTDGTPQGTSLILDINPGPAGSYPYSLTSVGNTLYFVADDGTNGSELWRSDGTAAGTQIVADISPGPASGAASGFLQVRNGVLYFLGTEPTKGQQLWRSDGTAKGTYRVTDIQPGSGVQSSLQFVGAIGAQLFLLAEDPNGEELWCTDGTPAGAHVVPIDASLENLRGFGTFIATDAGLYYTRPVVDPNFPDIYPADNIWTTLWFADPAGQHTAPIESYSYTQRVAIYGIAPFGDGIILLQSVHSNAGVTGPYGVERIVANGSPVILADVPANTIGPVAFAAYKSRLLFITQAGTQGGSYALWGTDGTAFGTEQLSAAVGFAPVDGLTVGADGVFFYASSGNNQYDIYRSDGTEAGTRLYAALATSQFSDIAEFNGKIYFAGGLGGPTGWEPWVSDGTAAGTHLLTDLIPGPGDSEPGQFTVIGDRMYFVGESAEAASLLYVSDGTTAGTVPLAPGSQPAETGSSNPRWFLAIGNRLVFVVDTWDGSTELWSTDGTTAGTINLNAPPPIGAKYFGSTPASLGSALIFWAQDSAHGLEPWVTDGTPVGTHLLLDINPGPASSLSPAEGVGMAVVGSIAYFSADDGVHGNELWRSDGTAAGTYLVADTVPGPGSAALSDFTPFNGQLVFVDNGNLWISDGTAAGTHITSNGVAANPSVAAVVFGNALYFAGTGPGSTEQLWRTDGTAAGTMKVTNLAPGATQTSIVSNLYATSDRVIFNFSFGPPSDTIGLYSSDGTAAGTQLIKANELFQEGQDYFGAAERPVALGANLYYLINNGQSIAVKVTDGTAAGTTVLMQFPNCCTAAFAHLAVAHGELLFDGIDATADPMVWRSDGTVAGTGLLSVIAPDDAYSYIRPGELVPLGNDVLLAANRPHTGNELYAIRGGGPYPGDDIASTPAGQAVTIPVLTNDGTLGAALNPASVTVASSPSFGTATAMGDGTIQYVPNQGASGMDQFEYTVADENGQTSLPANVSVIVARPAGPAPGTAPSGGGSGGGGSGGGSGGGGSDGGSGGGSGGGAFNPIDLATLALIALALSRRQLTQQARSRVRDVATDKDPRSARVRR